MSHSTALIQLERQLAELSARIPNSDAKARIDAASAVYLLAPTSFLGQAFASAIAQQLLVSGKTVFLVDDTLSATPSLIPGCTVIGSAQLVRKKTTSTSIAINMANTIFTHGFFTLTAAHCGISIIDIIPALDAFKLPVIYQEAQLMRDATLARLDDYLDLAARFDDALSVQTLGAIITMRATLDRTALMPILCSLEDEYFSPYPAGKDITFELKQNEILCDIGAHVGTTVYKFLTATRWQYEAIHAFEPDTGNFAALQRGVFEHLPNFHPKNIALSDKKSTLSFAETGTMGSRLDASGNVQIQASTLDDEVEHATFIKMDVEGHEARILQGARRLISTSRPRLAITGYHFANDLLEITRRLEEIEPAYRLRLRHHSFYYYDSIIYADIAS